MPRETEKHSLMMIGGKRIGGQRLGGRIQDGSGATKSEFFFKSLRTSHPRSGNYCVRDGECTHSVSFAHFSDTFSLRGVGTSRTRMGSRCLQYACHISHHLTFSVLMFHPPSLLFPHGHFETTFLFAQSLPNCFPIRKRGSSALPHERRGVLATWPIPHTPQQCCCCPSCQDGGTTGRWHK